MSNRHKDYAAEPRNMNLKKEDNLVDKKVHSFRKIRQQLENPMQSQQRRSGNNVAVILLSLRFLQLAFHINIGSGLFFL